MKEVKPPKKPLIYYYGIILVVLLLFNFLVMPFMMQASVEETDYGTFITMKLVEWKSKRTRLFLPIRMIPRFIKPV